MNNNLDKDKISVTESVLKNSVWTLLLSLLGKGGGLIFTILLARFLLPESFGLYSITLSVAMIFMSLGDLGINRVFLVLFSKMLKKNEKIANSYFNYLLKLKLSLLFLISLILFFSSGYLEIYFRIVGLGLLLKIASFYIFFFSLSGFFASIFYIYKKVKLDFFKELIFQIIRLVLILAVFLYLPAEYHLISIFGVLAISSIGLLIFSIFKSKSLFSSIFSKSETNVDKKRVIGFLSFLIFSGVLMIIFADIDILMLGKLSGDLASIGYYKAAITLILSVAGLCSITAVLLPIFSSFKRRRLENAIQRVLKYSFLITIPATFGVLVLGRYFLRAIYGNAYVEGAIIMSFLAVLIFSETLSGFFSDVLSSLEKSKFMMYSLLISTIINIVLNYILITSLIHVSFVWAASGAAIATSVSRLIFMFSLIFYSKKELNLRFPKKDFFKPLFSSIIMFLLLFWITQNIRVNLFSGINLVILGGLIYFLIMFIIKGINKEDFNLIKMIFKKR